MKSRLVTGSFLLCVTCLPARAQVQQRPYRISDSFEQQEFGAVAFSPDGKKAAFSQTRPASSQVTNALNAKQVRSDVWLQEAPGEPARNVTQGAADSSGWWQPRWSPDGDRLAMLSSRGGTVTLWVWEGPNAELRQVSPLGLDIEEGCRWLDERDLLCVAMPEGVSAAPFALDGQYGGVGRAIEAAEAIWAKVRRGERTVSALNSREFNLPQRRLVRVDVATGTQRFIARMLVDPPSTAGTKEFWVSPDQKTVAYIRVQPIKYNLLTQLAMGFPASIELKTLDGQTVELDRPLPGNVVTSTLQWSHDGSQLAFFALGDEVIHPELLYGEAAREVSWPQVSTKEYPGQLWLVDVKRGRVERLSTGAVDLGRAAMPPTFQWTATDELLFRAPRLVNGARATTGNVLQWLVLRRDGRTRPLTDERSLLPDHLRAIGGGAAFVGVMEGELWRVDARTGAVRNLTAGLNRPVSQLLASEAADGRNYVLLSSGEPSDHLERVYTELGLSVAGFDNYVVDLDSGHIRAFIKPASDARLMTAALATHGAVYSSQDGEGTTLWRVSERERADRMAVINTFMREIVRGEGRLITYTSLNGVSGNKAFLVLPFGYRPGRRYPLVVDFDIGISNSAPERMYAQHQARARSAWYEDLWSSGGYIYMYTSAPADAMDETGRANLLQVGDGVLAATEAVVREALADPDRVFLYGGSSAGYGVYALVTQTSRYKAAVANVGWVDQVSQSLMPSHVNLRHTDYAFYYGGQVQYSNNPLLAWRDIARHRRNSPLEYVDRVQTPLMLMAGEFDSAGKGLVQEEMFFGALVQQRKPAAFVRYWGEGHVMQTPANVCDYWQRVLAWYDKWGDIRRDPNGEMIWEGDRVATRNDAPALEPEDFATFEMFNGCPESGVVRH